MEFRWIDWNVNHIAEHGVTREEAEQIVRQAEPPYAEWRPDDKWLVIGRGQGGRFLQVIYVLDEDRTVFVIHARPLTEAEKKRYRRRRRK